jgi:hypothetical protein
MIISSLGGRFVKPRKYVFLVGGSFAIVTFLLFYIGVVFALDQKILVENILAFALFASLVGLIAGVFAFIKHNLGLIIFSVGYLIAFASMIYVFLSDMTGWEGLIGLLQMMIILGASILLATIAEIILYFVNKSKLKKHYL